MNNIALTRLIKLLPLVLWLCMPGLLQASVTAQLETNTLYLGDSITLRITTTGSDQEEKPDLAPLQKDFEVLGSSNSRQIQIINGRRTDRHEWLFELAPVREGNLIIPPLTVGNSNTAALTLQVNKQPATAQAGQSAFIRAVVSPAEADTYVQQQILYTTRLYYRIPLIEGDFSDPQIENAVVERLGEDKQYKSTINGQNYRVLERHYAVFPEHSGKLEIGPAVFTGRTVSSNTQRSRRLNQNGFNNNFFAGTPFGNRGKRIQLRADAITLDVKPRPDSYNGANWLPSQKLILKDSWAEAPPVIRAGEPVTRTLTLEARGLEASQLPDLKAEETSHLKIYPEQPELTNRTDGDWVYGRSVQRYTYVAGQSGKIELPEIRIDWWDSINHKPQTTVLPAWEILVEPGDDESATATTANETVMPDNAHATDQKPRPYWQYGGVLAVIVMLAAFTLIRRSSSTHRQPAASNYGDADNLDNRSLSRIRKALQTACAREDAQAAADALLDWAAATCSRPPPPRSLGALAERVDRGAAAIRELENALYSASDHGWTGQPLWKAFVDGLQTEIKVSAGRQKTGEVPPLYPDWGLKAD